ncbi:aspartate aminotransferase family protein [Evansella sp. AB-rgal1]|uniref:aspartate aminotransferase family protein n=1 Tax=Evansella sp. AB-rgal1 TaxID=3242696 RepID=UPI00359EEDCD
MAIRRMDHPFLKYGAKTEKSYEAMMEAEEYLPGGVTANIKHFSPYPIVMKKGHGAWLEDVDGNPYVDFLMAYGALALGHGHDDVKNAIMEQVTNDGTFLFGTPHMLETRFAKKVQSYYPSMEKIRFTNSGTEATLLAIRLACAYTGKKKIAKFEGHYHGGYNEMLYSINPTLAEAGKDYKPNAVPESAGLEQFGDDKPLVLPFNNSQATERLIKRHANELAAVIIEPVQGGFIPADQKFMDRLKRVAKKYDVLLIFDEVKTGFRVALGGAQQVYNLKPDITTLGKVIGGGFPIGIVGGREEILAITKPKAKGDVFDAGQGKNSSAKEILFHSGTYNGHPTILAAGLATMERLEQDFDDVLSYTNILRENIEKIARSAGIPLKTLGLGTIFSVLCTSDDEIKHYRDLQKTDLSLRKKLDFHLLEEGIYTKPLNRYSISTAHGDRELDKTLKAYDKALQRLGDDGAS